MARKAVIIMSILNFISPASSAAANVFAQQIANNVVASQEKENKINTIAAVIIFEAGGEGVNGMKAVAEVIYNRACTVQYMAIEKGKSVSVIDAQYAVVTAKKQFSCLNTQSPAEAITKASNHKRYDIAKQIVTDSIAGKVSGLTNNSNHYCRFDCFPKWRDDSKMTVRIGAHVFFKL